MVAPKRQMAHLWPFFIYFTIYFTPNSFRSAPHVLYCESPSGFTGSLRRTRTTAPTTATHGNHPRRAMLPTGGTSQRQTYLRAFLFYFTPSSFRKALSDGLRPRKFFTSSSSSSDDPFSNTSFRHRIPTAGLSSPCFSNSEKAS